MAENRGKGKGISRRGLLKVAAGAGVAGLAGFSGYALVRTLAGTVPPDVVEVKPSFVYAEPAGIDEPVWYQAEGLVGSEAQLRHFVPGRGAHARWRAGMDDEGRIVHPGLPALLIQMEEDELTVPQEFPREAYVIDGLYAVFDCCTHACCRPGWQLIPQSRYQADLGYANVYCPCHDSQYNPRRLSAYTHPPEPEASGARYLGIYKEPGIGPAPRGMPLIPLHLEGDTIIGEMQDPAWYRYLDFGEKG